MTDFLQNLFAGVALGSTYALVALGFVIIFKSTGVVNFAQGGLLAVGAYLTYTFTHDLLLTFALAALLACAATALVGVGFERVVLRRMVGETPFSMIMVTIGLLFVLEPLITIVWGFDRHDIENPWNIQTISVAGLLLGERDVWAVGIAAVTVAGVFWFFKFASLGLAMRVTAFDAEAAMAQGISARRVHAVAWAIAAALGALAGVIVAAGPAGVSPTIGYIAFAAFPAMIVGGMDSPLGAVIAALIIGVAEALTRAYQNQVLAWAGDDVSSIVPYLVMVAILVARPQGLLGTREVRRI